MTTWFIVGLIIALVYYWARIANLERQKLALINSLASAMLSSKDGKETSAESLVGKYLSNIDTLLSSKDYNAVMKALATATDVAAAKDADGNIIIREEGWLRDRLTKAVYATQQRLIEEENLDPTKVKDWSQYDVENYR